MVTGIWPSAGSFRSRLIVGAFWCVVGSGIGQGMSMVAAIVCAHMLGSNQYGQLGIIQSTVNLFALVGSLGLGITATKHVAEYRQADPGRAGRVLGLSALTAIAAGIAVGLLLVVFAFRISRNYLDAPELSPDLRIAAVAVFFSGFNGYQVGALSGFEAFRPLALASLIKGFITLPVFVVGILAGGRRGAVIALALVNLLNCVVYAIMLSRQCDQHHIVTSYRLKSADWHLLYRFSIPVVLSGLSFTPAVWWTNVLLARSSGYSQLGVFSAAFQWHTIILFFSGSIGALCLPLLSSVLPERNMSKYLRVLLANFIVTTASALAIAIPVAIAAPLIAPVYGATFAGATKPITLLCVAAVFTAAVTSVGYAIWSLDAVVSGMLLALLRGSLLVAIAYALRRYGASGLAASYAVLAIVWALVSFVFIWWLLRRRSAEWRSSSPYVALLGSAALDSQGGFSRTPTFSLKGIYRL